MPEIENDDVFPPDIKPAKSRWRCINEILGYCNGEPEEAETFRTDTDDNQLKYVANSCKNNPKTCPKFRWLSEMIDLSTLPEPKVAFTLTPPEEKEQLAKPKTKRAKKLEADLAQQKLI